ncbi:MAG: flippase-like domain-containing protein [Saprospiraceae bacterium]|uniref:Flippase-like domain-containing protein n=1 Tax=Candidatus Opimibacter skivensis TaxID=2982028 RepID=A0A9D7XMP2_9BACT|nr:flippase-like domain-containing protein [Candidatus Opimibacter skivensis]
MNSKIISVLKYIVLLAVAIGLLALAFKGISVNVILHEMLQAKLSWLLIAVIIGLAGFVSRAIRWKLLIESLGFTPSLKNTTASLMVGYFANLAFPRLGEVTRCGSLSKAESIPFSSLLGTVIVERVIDVLSLLILLFLSSILEIDRLGNFLHDNIIKPLGIKLKTVMSSPGIIAIAIILFVALLVMIFIIMRRSKQNKEESKFVHLVKGLLSGLQSVAKLKRPWLFLFHSVFIWFLAFLGMYVSFQALPSTSDLGMTAALFILVISGLGMAAPVQGGIGAFHLLVSQGLVLYGLSQQDGLTFATLVHALSLVLVVVCGITSLILLFSANKKRLQENIKQQ